MTRRLAPPTLALLLGCGAAPKPAAPTPDDAGPSADDGGAVGGGGGGEGSADGATDSGGVDSGGAVAPAGGPVVVLVIGDGMGLEHVAAAGLYVAGRRDGAFLHGAPAFARVRTASRTGTTDSAAAATTLGAGVKTTNGALGLSPEGEELVGIVDVARGLGMATGVVTTDTLTGATPSAFLVHVDSRGDTAAIADQLAARLPDVLLGGGATDLLSRVDPVAAQVVIDAAGLSAAAVDARPLVGLFATGAMPFAVDDAGAGPRLEAMATTALDRLITDPEGALLVVEGARIDHASHLNLEELAVPEAAALDATVAALHARLEASGRAYALVVTADHECGGLQILEDSAPGEIPLTSWRHLDHTNAEVGAWAWGLAAPALAGRVVDNTAVWAALHEALTGTPTPAPDPGRLADGWLEDLGAPVSLQAHETDFGVGYNQLDGLRLTADATGLWIGLDGVIDDRANAVVVWIDRDFGAGTGAGAGLRLTDASAGLDSALGRGAPVVELPGLGFDAAVGSVDGTELRLGSTSGAAGARLFAPPDGDPADLWWQDSLINLDFARLARGAPAPAAGPTGVASGGGLEALVPWTALYPGGLTGPATLAVVVTLTDSTGATASNQALPPYAAAAAPAGPPGPLRAAAVLEVDATGAATGPARVVSAP